MQRVAVTGWGVVSPWGTDPDAVKSAVFGAKSSIQALNGPGETVWPPRTASRILDFNPRDHFSVAERSTLDRASQFALVAARQALAMAGGQDTWDKARSDILVGTGMASASTLEATYQQFFEAHQTRLKPLSVPTGMNNAAAAQLGLATGFQGANVTYCCACASSGVAIGEGVKRLRHGEADVVLAGGTESMILPGVLWVWEALRTLAAIDEAAPEQSCKPFSKRRSGLVMGEGAAFFVLEPYEAAKARGANLLGEIVGVASTSDSSHLTRPSVEGQARAMRRALQDAGLAPDAVAYINAHGTATEANDPTEAEAIRQVFGERVRVSSTKAVHGHWMGAASALELLVTMMALRDRAVPPTAFLEAIDPACALNHVLGSAQGVPDLSYAMSNSFAFGGTSSVLIAKAPL